MIPSLEQEMDLEHFVTLEMKHGIKKYLRVILKRFPSPKDETIRTLITVNAIE